MEVNPSTNPQVMSCPRCGGNLMPGKEGFCICTYCGTGLVWRQSSEGNVDHVVRGIKMKMFVYVEEEVTRLELFRMLIPAGWEFRGGCRWVVDNPGMPAQVCFQLFNPNGEEAFEVLPEMNFIWNNNPFTGVMNPAGARHFGAEVRAPVGIREAFEGLVLPRYRGRFNGMQVVHFEEQPELPRLLRSEALLTPDGSAAGGKVRIRYSQEGIAYEEELYGMVEVFRIFNPGMFGKIESDIWFIDYLFSFRAGAGKLDSLADIFAVMISSFRVNPKWTAAYKAITNQLIGSQMQHIRNIGQIGQIYAQTGCEIREQNLNDWYAREKIHDRISVIQRRTFREVDGFYDPYREAVVELPAGLGHAWANNLGEYIVTESASFNPNESSNLNWVPMDPSSEP